MQIFVTRAYERAIRRLLSEESRKTMEAELIANPDRAPVIRGTGGIRKLRWAGSGRGRRCGIWTICFYHIGPESIYLLTAYAKAVHDDLTPADKQAFSKLISTIKK